MELHAVFVPVDLPRGFRTSEWKDKKHWTWLSGHLEGNLIKATQSGVREKNDEKHYSLFTQVALSHKKKKERERDGWRLLYSAESGRIKVDEGWGEGERLSEREPLAVEQITDVCGVHTDFMKLIIKAAAGGKGQGGETHEDRRRKERGRNEKWKST